MKTRLSLPSLLVLTTACRDMCDFLGCVDEDGDGYIGNGEDLADYYGAELWDCDDTNEDIHPGVADDDCNTGDDEDCDASTSCFVWPAEEHTLDPDRSDQWYQGDNSARLGWAVGSVSVDEQPMALVSAPNAGGGTVSYLSWAPDGGLTLEGTITGPPGARLGAAMLPELQIGQFTYLVLGAPGASTVYAVETGRLAKGGSLDLSDGTHWSAGSGVEYEVEYDGALAASTALNPGAPHLFLGASGDDAVVPLSCSGAAPGELCSPTDSPLKGEEGSGFGAALAVLEIPELRDGLLAVAAPGTCEVRLFILSEAVSGERGADETPASLTIDVGSEAPCDMRLLAADRIVGTDDDPSYPELLLALPSEDRVYQLDGAVLWSRASEDASIGLSSLLPERWDGDVVGAGFGSALFSADLDGDGEQDLLVGAPLGGDAWQGEVRLYQTVKEEADTAEEDDSDSPARLWPDSAEALAFGSAIAVVPSLDGDPYPDVLIGAPDEQNVYPYDGSLYVVLGRGD